MTVRTDLPDARSRRGAAIRVQARSHAPGAALTRGLGMGLVCMAIVAAGAPLHANGAPRHPFALSSQGEAYAIVRGDQRSTYLTDDRSDRPVLDALRKRISGDFVWFRDGGKTWVVRDPAVIATVESAWAQIERTSRDMDAMGELMRQHGRVMETLGKEMEQAARSGGDIRAIDRRMQQASQPMEALGKKMALLGKQIERESGQANIAARAILHESLASGSARLATRENLS